MKKVLKIVGIVLLVLFALIVLIAIFGGDADNNGGSGNGGGTTNQPASAPVQATKEYGIGETWTVDGQWTLTVDSVEETYSRNEYADKNPAAVYIVSYTYSNIGYADASGIMDGLFFNLDDSIVDCTGLMGYSYPGEITDYPQETPIGATCKGQVCIGVDNAGLPIKLNVLHYDGNSQKQTAIFILN